MMPTMWPVERSNSVCPWSFAKIFPTNFHQICKVLIVGVHALGHVEMSRLYLGVCFGPACAQCEKECAQAALLGVSRNHLINIVWQVSDVRAPGPWHRHQLAQVLCQVANPNEVQADLWQSGPMHNPIPQIVMPN